MQFASISLKAAEQAMTRILSIRNPPTAVVATNDIFAVGSLMACRSRGVRVPQDISITGVNNTELGRDTDTGADQHPDTHHRNRHRRRRTVDRPHRGIGQPIQR